MSTITGTIEDATGAPIHARIDFLSKSTPLAGGGIVNTNTDLTIRTDPTAGTFSVNLVGGNYQVVITAQGQSSTFNIVAPSDNNTYTIDEVTATPLAFVFTPPNTVWNGARAGHITFLPIPTPPAADDPAWIVRDDYFSNTETGPIDFGQVTIKKEVFLSEPYTLAALDADTDALIDSINPDDLPWGTVTPVSYDDFGGVATDNASFNLEQYGHTVFNAALTPPQQHFFPPIVFEQSPDLFEFQTEPRFDSAAGYVYLPNGLPTATDGFDVPCGYAKWVSWVRMAGKYCLKTYYYDYAQKTIRSDCVTGRGSCASSFKVTPPAPVPVIGQNAYTALTPNGQCE